MLSTDNTLKNILKTGIANFIVQMNVGSVNISSVSVVVSGSFEPNTCPGDFDKDFDVDGFDAKNLSDNPELLDIETFSDGFGRVNCP